MSLIKMHLNGTGGVKICSHLSRFYILKLSFKILEKSEFDTENKTFGSSAPVRLSEKVDYSFLSLWMQMEVVANLSLS